MRSAHDGYRPVRDLRRPRPPEAPPLDCTPEEQQEWLDALRAVDADVTQFAAGIALEHFSRAGVPTHAELPRADDWSGFALYLMLSLSPVLDGGGDTEWVRALMADLVELSLLNPSGSPENRLAQLLAQFVQWGSYDPHRAAFIALLPPQAGPALELIREWEDEEERRKDEAYY